ncbi:MAG: transposase [Thermoanaerobaculia bacterium]|jgi:REP element-mobilizing transposase RayT
MARALRIENPGAVYHITSRGNERRVIFLDDEDREQFLRLLADAIIRFGWILTGYTLMTNHFHLVVETPTPTLSRGMQWLNGTYAAWFNRKYKRSGHLLGGRFHAFIVEKEVYYLELLRYVVLNPVRAKMVARPEEYRWSSYRAMAGYEPMPEWLTVDELAEFFDPAGDWRSNFRGYVEENLTSDERLFSRVQRQIYLGTEQWIASMRTLIESKPRSDAHPRVQREVGRPSMAQIVDAVAGALGVARSRLREGRGGLGRMVIAWLGWREGLHQLRTIADALGLRSLGRVSDLVREAEGAMNGDTAFATASAAMRARLA